MPLLHLLCMYNLRWHKVTPGLSWSSQSGCFVTVRESLRLHCVSVKMCCFYWEIVSQSFFFFSCPSQPLRTTYQWWQRTPQPHSVDIKPRISLSSALQREGNQPHRWVAIEDAPCCLSTRDAPSRHIDPRCSQMKRNCVRWAGMSRQTTRGYKCS